MNTHQKDIYYSCGRWVGLAWAVVVEEVVEAGGGAALEAENSGLGGKGRVSPRPRVADMAIRGTRQMPTRGIIPLTIHSLHVSSEIATCKSGQDH